MKEKLSAVFRRINLPLLQTKDWLLLHDLRKQLANIPRYTSGKVKLKNGWLIEYVDAHSLINTVEPIISNRWNDFATNKTNPVILDCGANIGITTLHYKSIYPEAHITAFEPDPEICEVLRRNLKANNINDVTVIEAAVWKENGELEFSSDGADAGKLEGVHKNSTDTLITEVVGEKRTRVKTIRLADYIYESKVDFIKMDIESAESQVLADCKDYLHNVGSMVIEVHLKHDRPHELAIITDALSKAKFNIAVNSYGYWVQLTNKDSIYRGSNDYDQYLLISAWHPTN